MLAATVIAIFLIPVLYVVVERIARSEQRMARRAAETAAEQSATVFAAENTCRGTHARRAFRLRR
jgi:hypothetical protein